MIAWLAWLNLPDPGSGELTGIRFFRPYGKSVIGGSRRLRHHQCHDSVEILCWNASILQVLSKQVVKILSGRKPHLISGSDTHSGRALKDEAALRESIQRIADRGGQGDRGPAASRGFSSLLYLTSASWRGGLRPGHRRGGRRY